MTDFRVYVGLNIPGGVSPPEQAQKTLAKAVQRVAEIANDDNWEDVTDVSG